MNCSEVVCRYLSAAGVRHIFGYPGDPNIEFMDACRRDQMHFVLATREGTAGFMAEAYGQITDRPGVCLSTLGPGSSNLVNPVATAWLDRVPMIALSGQIETKREPFFTHQVIDHERVFGPISKWATTIQPNTVATIMRKALRVAAAERPGPVHLSMPADVVKADALDSEIRLPPFAVAPIEVNLRSTGVSDPVTRIAGATRPIILVGISAARDGAGPAVTSLAEQLGCPVVVAPMAKGVIDESHPFYAGTLDMACNGFMWDFLRSSDLILNIGFDAVELIKPWNVHVPVIHIDSVPNTDQIYEAEIEVVGPVSAVVKAISSALPSGAGRWSQKELATHRAKLRALYLEGRVEGRLNPTDVVEILRAATSKDAIATTDVGSHKLLVGQGWLTHRPKGMLMTNGLSSMGYSLPAAITASLLQRDTDVICFTGDGGLAMVQGELRLAASLGLNRLTVVVFCDNSLNRIELKQLARQLPSFGTTFEPTDVPKLAESMACDAVEVDTPAALERALASSGGRRNCPLVVAAKIDPSQYAAQF
jgi:acetolactate synthase I/II/III large subunit